MSESGSFNMLDAQIQRYIWAAGWTALRDAQEAAIPLILKGEQDIIVAAATASGKTEAAFLPALTSLLQQDGAGLIVYIGPLKALINDQFGRLNQLCEQLQIPVWPWHGDISGSVKRRFLAKPLGVLLITPESLEAFFCLRGTSVSRLFQQVKFIIIDELHAFIGSERGKQLQSLLHRMEHASGKVIRRIGLSATLGDMQLAADFLRPGHGAKVALVQSAAPQEIKIAVKGFEEPISVKPARSEAVQEQPASEPVTPSRIATHLFQNLRGSNNLVFPNSRAEVERYTYLLNQLCQQQKVPNEFWPHHGNLSKEIRYETESELKQKERPASAICTTTLELGIDIGAVKSVAQILPPPSVASLRQRLGRSGRREGEPAILRGYCIEDAIDAKSSLAVRLRLRTLQMTAMIQLLLKSWFEPPRANVLHLSTLVQQVLSLIAQNGGATIGQLYALLCDLGAPFHELSKAEFASLVRHLGEKNLVFQDASGLLIHAPLGEKFVNHYSFYAAFASDDEFRVVAAGKSLGTLPIAQLLITGQRILFAGKTWIVDQIDEPQRTIYVSRSKGGAPPVFNNGGGRVHTRVRQRMRELLESREVPTFLDHTALRFLSEARACYAQQDLANTRVIDQGREWLMLTWLGDASNAALACLLRHRGFDATNDQLGVEVLKQAHSTDHILHALSEVAHAPVPPPDVLLKNALNLQREKWDWALPDALLRKSYASLHLDLPEAVAWARSLNSAAR